MSLSSQTIKIEKSYRLLGNNQKGFYPVFNAEGNLLAFTSENYQGLNVYNFSNKTALKISDEQGSGFQPVFSVDGKIYYKNTVFISKLKYEGLKSYDLNRKTVKEEILPQRNLREVQNINRKTVTPQVWSDGSNLYISKVGKTEILNPIENANGYVWTSLSPNGKMILFNAVAVGSFVSDLKGKIIASLGYLNAPVWYDNELVVGMQDKDDGYNVTESKVIIKNLAGNITKQLSEPGQIAMFPTASSAAGKVAYNTIEGDIYVLEFSINP
jgi:hypothetical protein